MRLLLSTALLYVIGVVLTPFVAHAMTLQVVEYGSQRDHIGAILAPTLDSRNTPSSLAVTDDGAIWFRETFTWHPRIARFAKDGSFREFPDPYITGPPSSYCLSTEQPSRCAPLAYFSGFIPLVADRNSIDVGPLLLHPTRVTQLSLNGRVSSRSASGCLAAGPNIACFPTSKVEIRFQDHLTYLRFNAPPSREQSVEPNSAVLGPDGNIWFTDTLHSQLGRVRPSGHYDIFTKGLTRWDSGPQFIALGPDGNLWFTEQRDRIGRIDVHGHITEFSRGISARSSLGGIVSGLDGALWFTLYHGMVLGRLTLDGKVKLFHNLVYPSDGHEFDPVAMIVRDKLGRLYFNEGQAGRIARVTISP